MSAPEVSHRARDLLRALLIIASAFWIFAPALRGDWLMDDDFYLTQNALLNDPHRLWKTWFAPGSLIEYYPLEASLQAAQWQLWHLHTFGYHLTNVILHAATALLVWRLLAKFGLRYAWLGGLLFAVHPTAVESVAWISEFKNVLSTPFLLLALGCWIDFDRRGNARDYLLALFFFLLAMLCKISVAPIPFVLLLYAWWRRDRLQARDFLFAAPFVLISLVLGLLSVLAGNWFRESYLQSPSSPEIGGTATHLVLAGESLVFYFAKFFWPYPVMPIYPQWRLDPWAPWSYAPWLLLIGVPLLFWRWRATWGRHALLGTGFFVVLLLPVAGYVSVTFMGFTWVMDHFLYLPIVGLIGLAVAGIEVLEDRLGSSRRPVVAAGLAVVFALLASESETYAGAFAGPEQLWTYARQHNSASWLVHNNLGNAFLESDRMPQAIAEYRAALSLNPGCVEAHANLGVAYEQSGDLAGARSEMEQALHFNPHFALAHVNLARVLEKQGDIAAAISHDEQALQINPLDRDTRTSLEALKKRKAASE